MLKKLFFLGFIFFNFFSAYSQEPDELVFGKTLEKTIAKGEVQRFKLTLKANQFARLELQQKGIVVFLDVLEGSQNRIIRANRPLNHFSRKIVSVLAEREREYTVEITPLPNQPVHGNQYSIKILELRNSNPADQLQIKAEKAFLNISDGYVPLAEREEFFRNLEELVSTFEKTQDHWYQSLALIVLGRAYALHNNRKKGIEYYQRSLDLQQAKNVNEQGFESLALSSIGVAYNFIGEPQLALDYLHRSLTIEKSIGNKDRESDILNAIGNVYLETGSYQKALFFYQQAVSLINLPNARIRKNMGIAYAGLGEYDQALDSFKLSMPNLDLEKPTLLANNSVLHRVAWIYARQGKLEKSKIFYESVLKLYRELGVDHGAAIVLTGLGDVYQKLGNHEKALQVLREAIPLREKGRDQSGEALTRYLIAKVYTDQGKLDEALAEIDKTIQLTEGVRGKILGEESRIEYLSSVFDYYELQIEILFRLHQKNPNQRSDEKAFQVSEKVRARSIIELLNFSNADIKQGISAELQQKEQELQNRINELARVKTEENSESRKGNEDYDGTLNKLFSEISEVRTEIRRQSPQYAALTQNLPPVDLEYLQDKILDPETLLLEYKLGKERSFVWAVTKKSFVMYELPKQEVIESKAKEFYSLITNRNFKPTETPLERQTRLKETEEKLPIVAKELSQLILSPVEKESLKKRIVIVADGSLQYIPFAALKLGNKYLVENSEIINLPSATFLNELRKKEQVKEESKKLLAVLADPVFDKNDSRFSVSQNSASSESVLPRLLFSRQEANAIASIVPKNELFLALDFKANKTNATSQTLSNYRIIHFATHGVLDSEHPELSGLIFSMLDQKGGPQNGFLRLHEIYNLRLPADLIVLSGCQTGLGKEVRGEGLIGLTRGFMYAGALRVAASLWQIDDSATAELMKYFYTALITEKRTPAEALRQAQLQMLTQKRWQNPYFWAGFTIQGDWK
jgi:CHAT domain-containing protein